MFSNKNVLRNYSLSIPIYNLCIIYEIPHGTIFHN